MRWAFFLVTPLLLVLVADSCGGSTREGRHARTDATRSTTCRVRGAHTERVNVSSSGRQANNVTTRGPMSASGRFVIFSSIATNLVPGDRNGLEDVFVRDRRLRQTTRVSISTTGDQANGPSYFPLISSNGHLVFFRSLASNLVPRDRDRTEDLFVHDLQSGVTRHVRLGWTHEKGNRLRATPAGHPACNRWCTDTVDADGTELVFTSKTPRPMGGNWHGRRDVFVRFPRHTIDVTAGRSGIANGRSEASSISADGTVVAFRSFASNLVLHDTNTLPDVFVRNFVTGADERVNVSSSGEQANAPTFRGVLSGDGRFVGFRSQASNLVHGDTNDAIDAFVHDRLTGRTTRISVSTAEAQARGDSLPWTDRQTSFMSRPFLSEHGQYAAFTSRAPQPRRRRHEWSPRRVRPESRAGNDRARERRQHP